jgi:Tol biopolymer transport system component
MRVQGGGRMALGGSIRDERTPAVSPDGRHVVYVSPGDDGIERLYIRRIDGSGDRILLGEGAAAWPVW